MDEREVNRIAGENIKNWRKKKNMSQKELGRLMGYTQNTITQWENGKSQILVEAYLSAAEILRGDPRISNEDVIDWLKKKRIMREMSVREFAKAIGIHETTLRKYESSKVLLKLSMLHRIAEAIGLNLKEISDVM